VKTQRMSYLLALVLCFNGYYATARRLVRHSNRHRNRVSRPQGSNAASNESPTDGKQLRSPDVVYVPTPYEAVDAMLKSRKGRQERRGV